MQRFALFLLRLYPATWRMRYEQEMRALLEDHPPGVTDIAGLVRNAATEWTYTFADPVAHPGVAGWFRGLFGWFGVCAAIQIAAIAGSAALRGLAGDGPAWVGNWASVVVIALIVRPLVTGLTWRQDDGPFRPMKSGELRFWWTALVLAVLLGHWSNDGLIRMWQFWMATPSLLMSFSDRSWGHAKARRAWIEAREAHRDKARGYASVARLLRKGLATQQELDDLGRDVARLRIAAEDAAAAYRAASLRRPAPPRPLGLS